VSLARAPFAAIEYVVEALSTEFVLFNRPVVAVTYEDHPGRRRPIRGLCGAQQRLLRPLRKSDRGSAILVHRTRASKLMIAGQSNGPRVRVPGRVGVRYPRLCEDWARTTVILWAAGRGRGCASSSNSSYGWSSLRSPPLPCGIRRAAAVSRRPAYKTTHGWTGLFASQRPI